MKSLAHSTCHVCSCSTIGGREMVRFVMHNYIQLKRNSRSIPILSQTAFKVYSIASKSNIVVMQCFEISSFRMSDFSTFRISSFISKHASEVTPVLQMGLRFRLFKLTLMLATMHPKVFLRRRCPFRLMLFLLICSTGGSVRCVAF